MPCPAAAGAAVADGLCTIRTDRYPRFNLCKPLPLIQSRASQTNHHPLTTQLTSFPGPAITTTANVAAAKTANPRPLPPRGTPYARTPAIGTRPSCRASTPSPRASRRCASCSARRRSTAPPYGTFFSAARDHPSSSSLASLSPPPPPPPPRLDAGAEAEAEHLSLAADARARCVVRPRAALVVNGRCTRGATGIRVQLARSEHNGRRGTGTKKDKSGKLTRARSRRSFLLRAYPTMKKNNPNTPIMIREAAGTLPKIFARYGSSPLPLLPPLLPPLPPSLHPPAPTPPPPPPLPRLPNARRKQHHRPPNPSRTLTPC